MASWGPEEWKTFPPLYTLQPVETTRQHQLQVWVDLVHDWASQHKQWCLVLADCPVFENAAIGRKLSAEGVQAVAGALIKDGRADRLDNNLLQLYAHRPADLANQLYAWVSRGGNLGGVYTIFELHDDSLANDSPCQGVDEATVRKAVAVLEDQGKAQLFQGTTTQEDGVKFFADS